MDQLTSIKSPETIKRIRYDLVTSENHSKLLILGSGESGFLNFSYSYNSFNFYYDDIKLVSEKAINRLKYGNLFYGLKNYNKLDYEKPLIKAFFGKKMDFDEIVDLDLEKKEVSLFRGKKLTFDYLVINTGYIVDNENLPFENIHDYFHDENKMFFDFDNIDNYEKLREYYDVIQNEREIFIYIQKDSKELQNGINMAVLLKKKFNNKTVNIFLENNFIVKDEEINNFLIKFLEKKNIKINFDSKIYKTDNKILINNEINVENKFICFCLNKKIPDYLLKNNLTPESFNKKTLINNKYKFLLSNGSYLFPDCTLRNKYIQTQILLRNVENLIEIDWFERNIKFEEYNHVKEFTLFENFNSIININNNTKSDFFTKKLNALKFFNRDNFFYMNLVRFGFYSKKLFRLR